METFKAPLFRYQMPPTVATGSQCIHKSWILANGLCDGCNGLSDELCKRRTKARLFGIPSFHCNMKQKAGKRDLKSRPIQKHLSPHLGTNVGSWSRIVAINNWSFIFQNTFSFRWEIFSIAEKWKNIHRSRISLTQILSKVLTLFWPLSVNQELKHQYRD